MTFPWLPLTPVQEKEIELSMRFERLYLFIGGHRPQMDIVKYVQDGLVFQPDPNKALDRRFLVVATAAAVMVEEHDLAMRCYRRLKSSRILRTARPESDPEIRKYLYPNTDWGISLYMWLATTMYRLFLSARGNLTSHAA